MAHPPVRVQGPGGGRASLAPVLAPPTRPSLRTRTRGPDPALSAVSCCVLLCLLCAVSGTSSWRHGRAPTCRASSRASADATATRPSSLAQGTGTCVRYQGGGGGETGGAAPSQRRAALPLPLPLPLACFLTGSELPCLRAPWENRGQRELPQRRGVGAAREHRVYHRCGGAL